MKNYEEMFKSITSNIKAKVDEVNESIAGVSKPRKIGIKVVVPTSDQIETAKTEIITEIRKQFPEMEKDTNGMIAELVKQIKTDLKVSIYKETGKDYSAQLSVILGVIDTIGSALDRETLELMLGTLEKDKTAVTIVKKVVENRNFDDVTIMQAFANALGTTGNSLADYEELLAQIDEESKFMYFTLDNGLLDYELTYNGLCIKDWIGKVTEEFERLAKVYPGIVVTEE